MSPPVDFSLLFQSWLAEHRGIVVKVARSFAPTPADATELEQELWLSLPAYAGLAKPSTWIYRVCLNTAIVWRRNATRREARIDAGADPARLSAETATPADDADDREILEHLYAGIHALPKPDRALVLLMLDGLSYREMSEVTGLTENHVGVALTRARQRLASLLKGVTDELE
jgi:RNA polymerase sigma-70 factor, ECF subfamily